MVVVRCGVRRVITAWALPSRKVAAVPSWKVASALAACSHSQSLSSDSQGHGRGKSSCGEGGACELASAGSAPIAAVIFSMKVISSAEQRV